MKFFLGMMIALIFSQSSCAETALLFTVQNIGQSLQNPIDVSLCLNGRGPLSCQNYQISSSVVSIRTNTPNQTYPQGGIKINTPGYLAALQGIDCSLINNGFCLFSVSDRNPVLINLFQPGWSTGIHIDGNSNQVSSVSCPTPNFCMAVDNAGNALSFNGVDWSAPIQISPYSLNAISCPSNQFCMAIDAQGNAFRYNGTWSGPTAVASPVNGLNAISCSNSTFCMAVGGQGKVYRYNGSWSSAQTINGTNFFTSISCPSSSFCMAVDAQGYELHYSNGSWSTPAAIDSYQLMSVSCVNNSFCMAVDSLGNALQYNGAWGAAQSIDGIVTLTAVSCPSTSFCMAGDDTGNVLIYNGINWSTPDAIGNYIYALSCANNTYCLAINYPDIAYTYRS